MLRHNSRGRNGVPSGATRTGKAPPPRPSAATGWAQPSIAPQHPKVRRPSVPHRSQRALHQQPGGTRRADDETASEDFRRFPLRGRRQGVWPDQVASLDSQEARLGYAQHIDQSAGPLDQRSTGGLTPMIDLGCYGIIGKMQDKSRLDQELVEDFVNNAHGNLDRVRDLLDRHRTIVNAAWDWGGGDWETGLGAAAHMGRRDIALLLLERGARMDIFTASMLGHLEIVRATIQAFPAALRWRGPHGITLLRQPRPVARPRHRLSTICDAAAKAPRAASGRVESRRDDGFRCALPILRQRVGANSLRTRRMGRAQRNPSLGPAARQLLGPRSIDTGCQRRSLVFCSTAGLTQLIGHLPSSTSASSRPTCRLRAGSKRAEADAVCALRMTLSILSIGLLSPGGSISSTSRPA